MNKRTMKSAWRKVAAITVTVAIIATLPMAANAETFYATNTVGNVSVSPASDLKWFFMVVDGVAQVGANKDGDPNGSWDQNAGLGIDETDHATITVPQSVTVDGTVYSIDGLAQRAFYGDTKIKDVTILGPATFDATTGEGKTYNFGTKAFHNSHIENLLLKGPATQEGGVQNWLMWGFAQSNTSWWPFSNMSKLKLVIVGPNGRTGGSRTRFKFGDSGATVFLPDRTDNKSWRNSAVCESTKDKVVWYGPDHDLDMTMSETAMTFVPKNEAGLTNVLAWASTIKTAFDMDVIVNITNRIEMSEGVSITEDMLQNVTLSAPAWYLRFAVTTQSQLDNVLAAVSADVPIMIDVSGARLATEISVPEGREVAIYCPGGWTFGRKTRGLIISFH